MSAHTLAAPVSGLIVALKDVPDHPFAAGWLGDGIAIDPIDDRVRAPADAIVSRVAGGGNAVELLTATGARVLVHVGVDSHRCGGFAPTVGVGDHVTRGDTLIRFDPAALAGYLRFLIVKLVVTNAEQIGVKPLATAGAIHAGQPLLRLARAVQPEAAAFRGSDQCVCTMRQPSDVRA